MGLWATISSCEAALSTTDLTANYSVVTNGEPKAKSQGAHLLDFLSRSGKLASHKHFDDPLTPPDARQSASEDADGKYLAFFDNHCVANADYFARAHANMEHYGMAMLHSTTVFHPGEDPHYHYRLKLASNFWAESELMIPNKYKAYRIAAGGHGGFIVRSDVWKRLGGYGPKGLFSGYAGEEITTDLRFWMFGEEVWLDPKLIHYHFVGDRGYPRHYTDDYYRNLMISANVIGGEHWMYKVYDNFVKSPRMKSDLSMYELMMQASDRSAEYAHYVRTNAKQTLEEQLDYFRENLIAY